MAALSARLDAVVRLLSPCAMLADVGTDHGLVPVTAVQRGVAQRAIATDLRDAPLRGARRNIEHAGVADRVAVLQGDGLWPLDGQPVDAAVIAGMSGSLMTRLCDAAPHVLGRLQQLVLQPNKDVPSVRAWALGSGWHLRDECMVEVGGRFFTICAFSKGRGADPAYALAGWTQAALCLVGPRLLARKDPVALRWCEAQSRRLRELVQQGVQAYAAEISGWQTACEYLR